jgi:methyl-accepting chemotaxis protein
MADNITDLAVRLEETNGLAKSNARRIEALEENIKTLHDTQISLVKIANSVENMGRSISEINDKIDGISGKQDNFSEKIVALENRPAQKTKRLVDDVVEKITWVIIGGLVAWFLTRLFPTIPW